MKADKKIVIIGAGPAGLTAAYELLQYPGNKVIILEETGEIGGISRTVKYNGNRMDIGGHRFFSKSDRVMDWWTSFLPLQGSAAWDDLVLHRIKPLQRGGPNPQKEDRVMLIRDRISRIFYLRKFFDYPISLKAQTFLNMGLAKTTKAGISYLYSTAVKRREDSLEDFMINRFGSTLYQMFFENYTEKVWGIHPSRISADWGAQRIKNLSLSKVLLERIKKMGRPGKDLKQKEVETSLIETFFYPKYGPGQLWETVAEEIKRLGGEIRTNCKVTRMNADNNRITSLCYEQINDTYTEKGDVFLSSMPVKDLIGGISGVEVPENIADIAAGLPYRDFITVGILTKKLNLQNQTKLKTVNDIIPDCWIYIQEPNVKVGRLQIFNNWSPYMVKDIENTVWIGMEYFCNDNDDMWKMEDDNFTALAVKELQELGIVNESDVLDAVRVKVKKAYPAYFGTYKHFDRLREYLDTFTNLYCIGRNGQHRYNNMDHSMLTAMEAAEDIMSGGHEKSRVWNINTDEKYHEEKEERKIS